MVQDKPIVSNEVEQELVKKSRFGTPKFLGVRGPGPQNFDPLGGRVIPRWNRLAELKKRNFTEQV